ncbi:MAG: SusC/RagA family TonB-linked outer membrane protein [Bacteroides sp.]
MRSLRRAIGLLALMGCLSLLSVEARAQSALGKVKVNLCLTRVTMRQVLDEIEAQTACHFAYLTDLLVSEADVTICRSGMTVEQALDALFQERPIAYAVLSPQCIVLYARKRPLLPCDGLVTDEAGIPLPGVTVGVPGTSRMTATDADGRFRLTVPRSAELQFSFVGMKSCRLKAQRRMKVTMTEEIERMDEVVVVGFGVQKRVNVTGAVSSAQAPLLASRPTGSVSEALAGILPGLSVRMSSKGGALDAESELSLRGETNLSNGSSLLPLILVDGCQSDINLINLQDIESISVLKDAASASIYGTQAPGGVVLITTKSGSEGRAKVSWKSSWRIQSALNLPKVVDSYRFALAFNEYQNNSGYSALFTDEKLKQIQTAQANPGAPYMWANGEGRWELYERNDLLPAANQDWLDQMYGTHPLAQEHNVCVSGGSRRATYYLSANYLDQNGLLRYGHDSKKRYNMKSRFTLQLRPWLTLGYNLRFTRTDYDAPSMLENEGDVNFVETVYRIWPNRPLKDPNGYYTEASKVYQLTEGGRQRKQTDRMFHQISIDLTLLKGLRCMVELNYNVHNSLRHVEELTAYCYDTEGNPYPYANLETSVSESTEKTNFFNPNIYARYLWTAKGHTLKSMAGFQCEQSSMQSMQGSKNGIVGEVPTLGTAQHNPYVSGDKQRWTTAGWFSRINYDYRDRYLLEFNLRRDGASRFSKEHRWNWLPSFSVGWNLAYEPFFRRMASVVPLLKLRASIGTLGNQNTDLLYPTYRTIRYQTQSGSWLVNGQRPDRATESQLVSPALSWESIRTHNIGLDMASLKNRLQCSIDLFRRKSVNRVGPGPERPVVLGAVAPLSNNLDTSTTGGELEVTWRDRWGKMDYAVAFNLHDSHTRIDRYPNEAHRLNQYYAGAWVGDIWGYQTVGIAHTEEEMQRHLERVDQSAIGSNWGAGDIMYADLNGDGRLDDGYGTLENHGDLIRIGNSTPRYNFGLDLTASYAGWDVKLLFQGVLKQDYMPSPYSTLFWGAVEYWYTNFFTPHLDYFRAPDSSSPLGANPNAYYPRPLQSIRNRYPQTRYVQNAAYARLKDLTVGYTLPTNWTARWGISRLRLSLSAENLCTWTSLCATMDPETIGLGSREGCLYPLQKCWALGLEIDL